LSAAATEAAPLLAHGSLEAPLAYRAGRPLTVRRYLEDVRALAALLPPTRHVLNVCADRYRFAVGLGACLVSQRVSLLPSTHTPEVIRRLQALMPDVLCLCDSAQHDIDLPHWQWQEPLAGGARDRAALAQIPRLPPEQLAAIVFTSGSTGTPLPYHKRWGRLAQCVRVEAERLGLDARAWTLIATVPPQHMYGFESSVLLALLNGHAFAAEHPFYPADIVAAVSAAPRPRALITTPVHLHTLIAAGLELPALDLVVSATAPLAPALALEAERLFGARLVEIYGSTETGQMASRRAGAQEPWQLWPGVRLRLDGELCYADGGHIEQPTALCDVLEPIGEQRFVLHGRKADLVNVAGKRSSLGYLNAQLLAIPGVLDGAFFWPQSAARGVIGVSRPAAAVVAPGLSAAQLRTALRERIDPVFLPRPLLLLERLPRNSTGKLPQEALQRLAAGGQAETQDP